ncbi:MAG TPA: response regulator [Thioalkalivibrio sp.]|nr:response regulator [Thioalkalivibrio sp.]
MAVDQDTVLEARPVILIVDDSRVMRQALKKILAPLYGVAEAGDGEEGWSRMLERPAIAGVFTDLSMPRLDGFGLMRRIRESGDEGVNTLPILLITGNEDSAGTRERALAAGATGVIMKPFNAADVLGVVQQHVPIPVAAPPPPAPPSGPSEADGLRVRVAELEDTLREVRSQLKGWQDEMRKSEAASVSASAELEEALDSSRRQLREALAERDRSRTELERLRTELILRQQSVDEKRVSERICELEAQLQESQAARQSAEEVAAGMTEQLQRIEQQSSARTQALESKLESTRAALQSAQEELAHLDEATARTRSLETQLQQVRGELSSHGEELAEVRAQLQTALEQRQALEDRLSGEQDDRLGLEDRLDTLQESLTEREQLLAEREEGLVVRDREATQLRDRATRAEQALERLETQAREAVEQDANEEDTQAMLTALRTRAEHAELNQLQLEDELVELAAKQERSDQAREAAERELRSLMQELADARRALRERRAKPTPAPAVPEPAPVVIEQSEPETLSATQDDQDDDESFEEPAGLGLSAREPDVEEEGVPTVQVGESVQAPHGRASFTTEPLIRQWEVQRRRQRRMQVVILVAVAVVASLGLYFLLT